MRTFKEKIEEELTLNCIDETSVELCPICAGIGSIVHETEVYRGEYEYTRTDCDTCGADGRVVMVKRMIVAKMPQDQKQIIPYHDFEGEKFAKKNSTVKVRMNFRNTRLEDKYPALKEKAYDEYDKLLNHYEMLDNMENAEKYRIWRGKS